MSGVSDQARVHVASDDEGLIEAVHRAGASPAPLDDAVALIWHRSREEFPKSLPDGIGWVQLPSAGVEGWFEAGVIDKSRVWTSAAGAYADSVAEHALTLLLAGVRAVPAAVTREDWQRSWVEKQVGTLRGSRVLIVGAGGIGRALTPMLTLLGAEVIAVNRSGREVPGATRTEPAARLDSLWAEADHVVVAAPATPATHHLIGAEQLARLRPTTWIVNVARGSLIDHDALVSALRDGVVGGAALDVTEPEPLPARHPLWFESRAIITPHVANPPQALRPAFAAYVADNVARRISGRDLRGVIDPDAGY